MHTATVAAMWQMCEGCLQKAHRRESRNQAQAVQKGRDTWKLGEGNIESESMLRTHPVAAMWRMREGTKKGKQAVAAQTPFCLIQLLSC